MSATPKRLLALLAIAALPFAACGSDDTSSEPSVTDAVAQTTEPVAVDTTEAPDTTATTEAPATTDASTTTEAPVEPLRILVTNDDGIGAPGIDALVTALSGLDDVEITVVGPAENQSGTSMNLTDGELVSTPATTASGREATAIAGFPADSVRWALENLDTEFDLVVSGSNTGQNIGDFSAISGTVGAARYAAQQGIPAVAVSQGFVAEGETVVFDDSVGAAVEWITQRRADYESGIVTLTSINSPTCPGGVRGVVEVPLGVFDGRDAIVFDCASALTDPVDDVDAFANGFTAVTDLPIQL